MSDWRKIVNRVPGGQDDYIEAHEIETTVLPKNPLVLSDFTPDEKVRRLVGGKVKIVRRPHVEAIAEDLWVTLMEEARRLRDRAQEGLLNPAESAALLKIIDGMTKLSREMREKDKQEAIEDLTDAEWLEQVEELKKRLEE